MLVKTISAEDAQLVKKRILEFGVGEDVETWEEALPDVVSESVESFAIINMISVLGSLVIAVVLIFIMTTIKTFNNRKQIGILKAIGLKKSIIINSYVMQVIFICLIGAILGSLLIGTMVLTFTTYPIEFPDGDVTPHCDVGDDHREYDTPLHLVCRCGGVHPGLAGGKRRDSGGDTGGWMNISGRRISGKSMSWAP